MVDCDDNILHGHKESTKEAFASEEKERNLEGLMNRGPYRVGKDRFPGVNR